MPIQILFPFTCWAILDLSASVKLPRSLWSTQNNKISNVSIFVCKCLKWCVTWLIVIKQHHLLVSSSILHHKGQCPIKLKILECVTCDANLWYISPLEHQSVDPQKRCFAREWWCWTHPASPSLAERLCGWWYRWSAAFDPLEEERTCYCMFIISQSNIS